jgi:outer membrane protein OmpA-like peptidoglycan-associated protein
MRNRALLVLALLLAAAGCGGSSEPSTTSSTQAPEVTEVTVVDLGAAETYELGVVQTHSNGSQLRVDRVQFFETATVLEIGISNGSRFGLELTRGTTQLISGAGEVAALGEKIDVEDFGPGEDRSLSLVFGAIQDRAALTLVFNEGGGASPRGSSTSAPTYVIGPMALDPSATRPALPAPAALDRTVIARGGAELNVEGLVFTPTRIGLSVTIQNRTGAAISISPAAVPSYMVDDLGNPYFIVMPEGQGFIPVPAGEALSGVLSFAGRIDQRASVLTVGINDDRSDRLYAEHPRFVIEDIPISGDTTAALPPPDPIRVGADAAHPAGVSLSVDRIGFGRGGVEVDVVVANQRDETVQLASSASFLIDDFGTVMPFQPPLGNPSLAVEANSEITATLAFRGEPSPDAGEISLVFNDRGSTESVDTSEPSFRLGPFALTRPTVDPAPLEAVVFPVGLTSRLESAELTVVESQIQAVASILRQFDATAVEGGFRLTLPDDILFDFGSALLRDDALQSLGLIAEVLDYFEGDQVLVVGHTDSIGSEARNRRLSLDRAENVVDALIATLGIDPERVDAEGRGDAEPIAPNTNPDGSDNPDGRQLNRRVEIIVLTTRELPGVGG